MALRLADIIVVIIYDITVKNPDHVYMSVKRSQ